MCDPWESAQLVHIMEHDIPTEECSFCLPDCSRTIYQYTASGQLIFRLKTFVCLIKILNVTICFDVHFIITLLKYLKIIM